MNAWIARNDEPRRFKAVSRRGLEPYLATQPLALWPHGIVACSQFNPKKTVEYKQSQVKSVHLVVGVDYLER